MDLEKLNAKIESSNYYKFTQRHKKVINVIQGLFIIGLLVSLNLYVVKDHFVKKQIADNCGYTTSQLECVCEKNYVDGWKELQNNNLKINFSEENVKLVR